MFETTRGIAGCYTAVYGTMLCCTASNCPLLASFDPFSRLLTPSRSAKVRFHSIRRRASRLPFTHLYQPSINVANSQAIESCVTLLSSSNENCPDEALTGQRQNRPDKDTASGLAGYVCNHIHRPSNKISQAEQVQRCWRKSNQGVHQTDRQDFRECLVCLPKERWLVCLSEKWQ